jgi:L-seryl-tRNA(Ser) seleniumtransferase
VERLRRHPLARALRVDKLTLAALEATLGGAVTPTWQALRAAPEELRTRAERLSETLADAGVPADVAPSTSVVGGGGAPGLELASWGVALPEGYAEPLRGGDPPVVGRVERGRLLLDLRCVPADLDTTLQRAIQQAAIQQAAVEQATIQRASVQRVAPDDGGH